MHYSNLQRVHTPDLAMGARILNACWWLASAGSATFQVLLLVQAWQLARLHALTTAALAGVWVLAALLGARTLRSRLRPVTWGCCLLVCAALLSWLAVGWTEAFPLPRGALLLPLASLMGLSSAAWLAAVRPWPPVGERTAHWSAWLCLTLGLFVVWTWTPWAAPIGGACLLPLLALDALPWFRSPLSSQDGVIDRWQRASGSPARWRLRLETRGLAAGWWRSYVAERGRGYAFLTVLGSLVAVLLGATWNAVPIPIAAGFAAAGQLHVLGWLIVGQSIALLVATRGFLKGQNPVGGSDRLPPEVWQRRAQPLAICMLFVMGACLVLLGLPWFQEPGWLALSLAGLTLAGAVWGMTLVRLRPSEQMLDFAYRHLALLEGGALQERGSAAYRQAQEDAVRGRLQTWEGVLVATLAPLVGGLIDLWSVDRLLVYLGSLLLLIALGATLYWTFAIRPASTLSLEREGGRP